MLNRLFQPSSIAIIGASREPTKLGYAIVRNIINSGFKGKIFPVNKNATKILGLPCFPDVTSISGTIDLLIFSVPAPAVLSILKSAIDSKKEVKSAVIITAGFKEIGPEGARLEKEIQIICKQNNIHTIGPNCIGFIDTATPLNATFSATDKMPPNGQIVFFSQSGALSMAILDWAIQEKIGLSKLISLGNKIDIDEVSLLEYLANDKSVRVILGYLEGIDNGRGFMQVASWVSRFKPIIMVKGGASASGARAASSHTGSLAGKDISYKSAFTQSGVIRAETITELFDIARAFVSYPPYSKNSLKGPRIAIVTNSGGPAVLATDCIEKSSCSGKLKMAFFTETTLNTLRSNFPAGANIYNPVDVIADANYERYKLAINEVHNDKNVDGILVIYTPVSKEQPEYIARATVEVYQKGEKPILACFMGGEIASHGIKIIKQAGIPDYPSPERAVSAFESMFQHYQWQNIPLKRDKESKGTKSPPMLHPGTLCSTLLTSGKNPTTDEVLKILNNYNINIPDFRLAQSLEDSIDYAEEIGYPVVLKVVSPEVSHKTDFGAVKLNIHTPAELNKAFREIMDSVSRYAHQSTIKGLIVQKMITGGKEVIIGVSRDNQFGHLIMFGLGGIYVEVLKDVSFRLAPLKPSDVDAMLHEIKAYPLLKGIRGEEPSDVQSIKETILKVSQLVTDFPGIAELDINPYKVFPKGGIAIDARINIH
jgi:acetyltransferase